MCLESLIEKLSKPKRLLVVDDDDHLLEVVKAVCERYWLELVTAQSVAQARALIDGTPPFTAAILDVRLINGSGLDVYRLILQRSPSTQVVFLTGYDNPGLRSKVEAIGPARVHDKVRCAAPDFLGQLLPQLGFPSLNNSGGEV